MFFKFCDAYNAMLKFLIHVAGLTLLFSVGLQVAGRYIWFIPPYLWTLEVTNFALIWGIFIGASIAMREHQHFFVDIFEFDGKTINPKFDLFLRILSHVITAGIAFVFIYYGWQYFTGWGMIQYSDITGVNLGWLYFSVPVAGASFLLFLLERVLKEFFISPKNNARS